VKIIVLNGGLTPVDFGCASGGMHAPLCAKTVIWGQIKIQDSSASGAQQRQYEILL
jgi:hypothetical protein